MATYTRIATSSEISMGTFRDVLEGSGLFTSVRRDGYYDIECYIGEHKFLNFHAENTGAIAGLSIYTEGGNIAGTNNKAHWPLDAWQCSGGLALICKNDRIVLTKNQNDETVVICGNILTSTSDAPISTTMATIYGCKYSDPVAPIPYTTNLTLAKQTVLIPVCTTADQTSVSYTEHAKFAAYSEHRTVAPIMYNNRRYFFDGYFAIEDELEATS